MRIRFKQDCELILKYDICCFSGDCREKVMAFKTGEVLLDVDVEVGEKEKRKGGAVRLCTIWIKNENHGNTNLDRISNVPDNLFEIMPEVSDVKPNGLMDCFCTGNEIHCSGTYLPIDYQLPGCSG